MTYLDAFKSGTLVLPSALLLHFKELFPSSDDFSGLAIFLFAKYDRLRRNVAKPDC